MTWVGRLERYMLMRTLGGVGSALAVIVAVIVLVQFVDLSRQVGVRVDVGPAQLFGLTLLRAPSVIQILLPFVFLFGVIAVRGLGILEAVVITCAVLYLILDVRTDLQASKNELRILRELEQRLSPFLR